MKTAEQIAEYISTCIGHVYFRPLMYGGTPEGVDAALFQYHQTWAEIHEVREKFWHEVTQGNALGFAGQLRWQRPDTPDAQVADYVVSGWRGISKRLGIRVPYAAIRAEFRGHPEEHKFADEE